MEYITTLIIIIVVSFVIKGIRSSSKKKSFVGADGTLILKYSVVLSVIGYITIGFGFLMWIVTIFDLIETTGDEVLPYLVSFFVILGLPLILIEKNIRVLISDEKICYTGITKKMVEILWSDIVKVSFSFTSQIVLHTVYAKIKLNTELSGFESFIEMMKLKLEPALYENALQEMNKALSKLK
jgi:hypothetical protein